MGFKHYINMRIFLKTCIRLMSSSNNKIKEKFVQKTVRVAILGAATGTGQALALLLKQNPLISHVYLYDGSSATTTASDLKHIDTRCDVTGFSNKEINLAIRNADIIVLLGLELIHRDAGFQEILRSEGGRLLKFAKACCTFAPRAILVDCVTPVSVSLPLISEVYRNNHWYHPGRVIGSVSLFQIRLNTLLANHQNLDPSSVHVPLLAGPDFDTVLPLFSRALPSPVAISEAKVLINRFRELDDDAKPTKLAKCKFEYAPNSNGFAINRLVTTIALGLLGDGAAVSTAFVRSNFAGACRHLVSTVKFGPNGVVHNYGVPRLTRFELRMFERICLELGKREDFAKYFYESSIPQTETDPLEELDYKKQVNYSPYANPDEIGD